MNIAEQIIHNANELGCVILAAGVAIAIVIAALRGDL